MIWVILLVLVVLGAVLWIFAPLFGSKDPWRLDASPTALNLLRDKKEQALRLIKDLEQEYEARAIDPAEYAVLRERYLSEAAVLNRRLIALQGLAPRQRPPHPPVSGVENDVENDSASVAVPPAIPARPEPGE